MELDILHAIAEMHNGVLDKIMMFITALGNAGIIWIALAVVMLFFKKYRKCGISTAIALVFSLIICNLILKNLVARVRPFDADLTLIPLVREDSFSFPSGHTSASFAAAISIFHYHKKEGIAAIILALLIGFSRLYVSVHYPTDVLGGIVTGAAAAILSIFIVKLGVKKIENTKLSAAKQ